MGKFGIRHFDGKRFMYEAHYSNKADANKYAKYQRENRKINVRIITSTIKYGKTSLRKRKVYIIYTRKR